MKAENQHRIEFAHLLRGIAALCVVIWHYYTLFWLKRELVADFVNAPLLSDAITTPAVVTLLNPLGIECLSWGNYGVAVFFIISGFVMPMALQKHSITQFLNNRFFRIVPVYVVGFTITLIAIWASGRYFGKEFSYRPFEVIIHYLPGLRDLFGVPAIDGIVWTLEIEIKFYLSCVVIWQGLKHGRLAVFLFPVLIALASIVGNQVLINSLVPYPALVSLIYAVSFSGQFIVFIFIGVIFNFHYRRLLPPVHACLLLGLMFGLFMTVWALSPNAGMLPRGWSYLAAVVTFWLCYAFRGLLPKSRMLSLLADISYPLYVVHGVAGYVGLRILLDQGVSPLVSLLLTTVTALVLSWVLHRTIEKPVMQRFHKR